VTLPKPSGPSRKPRSAAAEAILQDWVVVLVALADIGFLFLIASAAV